MNNEISLDLLKSWTTLNGAFSLEEIFSWIDFVNSTAKVTISETSISKTNFWKYDESRGEIVNAKGSFFSVKGIEEGNIQQPILIQNEVGILGIIAKYINGVIHFLMQAKIEPGNINCVQISPTVQATKSNYSLAHGGKMPSYTEYFLSNTNCHVIYNQLQSEQGSRFFKKKNRNIVILVDDEIEVLPNFKWMTLGQIKSLMNIQNLVNMDTRTVISGLPFSIESLSNEDQSKFKECLNNNVLFNSLRKNDKSSLCLKKLEDFRSGFLTKARIIPLTDLKEWKIDEYGITHLRNYHFEIKYYDIYIEGREVNNWVQPMVKASGIANFVLCEKIINDTLYFLIKIKHEIGCDNVAEFGPSLQIEYGNKIDENDFVGKYINECLNDQKHQVREILLSEEGGRFYHEENNNYLMLLDDNELTKISDDYIWVTYKTIYEMIKQGGLVNIQLRNLLSLIDLDEGKRK